MHPLIFPSKSTACPENIGVSSIAKQYNENMAKFCKTFNSQDQMGRATLWHRHVTGEDAFAYIELARWQRENFETALFKVEGNRDLIDRNETKARANPVFRAGDKMKLISTQLPGLRCENFEFSTRLFNPSWTSQSVVGSKPLGAWTHSCYFCMRSVQALRSTRLRRRLTWKWLPISITWQKLPTTSRGRSACWR
jgi:hypothetical protein